MSENEFHGFLLSLIIIIPAFIYAYIAVRDKNEYDKKNNAKH